MLTGRHRSSTSRPGCGVPSDYHDTIAQPLADLSPRCRGVFTRALAIESNVRPKTPAAFLAELEDALA